MVHTSHLLIQGELQGPRSACQDQGSDKKPTKRELAWSTPVDSPSRSTGTEPLTHFTFGFLDTGAANIGDAGKKSTVRADKDVVPEAAVRPSSDGTDYHTGRGGAGNAHVAAAEKKVNGEGGPISFADKLKAKIFGRFTKK